MRKLIGLNYYSKLEIIIKECIEKAKANPFEQFIFIAEDKKVIEKMFLKQTHYLVNIEIKQWNQFLRDLIIEYHQTNKKIVDEVKLIYLLNKIFHNNHFKTFHNNSYYPIINKLIPILKQIEINNTIYTIDNTKLNDIMTIYHLLKDELNNEYLCYESILDNIEFNKSHTHIYIEADHLIENKKQDIIHRLDEYNDITLLYTYSLEDKSYNKPFHHLNINGDILGKSNFLLDNIFSQSINHNDKIQNLYTFVASTPQNEVKRVIYYILEMIVERNLKYNDFVIAYPDSSYEDILLETLNQKNIPHNMSKTSICTYDTSYQLILKEIEKLDTQSMKESVNHLLQLDIDKEYIDYLNSIQYDDIIDKDEFREFFLNTCKLNKSERLDNEDHIHICLIDDLKSSQKKHVFILGMNETILPHLVKDTSLLLDEDIHLLRKNNISTPLTSLENLGVHHNNILKALQCPYLSMTFSYTTSTLSNETRLPSSLYNQLKKMYNLNPLPINQYMSIDDYYLMGGRKEYKDTLNNHINHYIETKNQPGCLNNDMIPLLYKDHLSVSQVETYNKCPYLYYIQYGLSVFKSKEDKLLPNELGSLVHYVLSITINEDKNIDDLVDYYLSKNSDLYDKIISSPINQYFINNLKKDLVVTLQVLKNMNDKSLFEVTSKEEKIEDKIHGLNFKGFVDRIDTYNNYVSIIDYKSSAKDIDIDLAKKGFNIQMLLYLKMITKKYEKDPAAVLYFNTKKRVLVSKDSVNDDIKENDFYSMYKYGGYVIDDDSSVIHAIDTSIDSKSDIVNVKYVKKSGEYKGHIMTNEQLDNLINDIEEHIYHLYTLMNEGHIEIFPKDSDNQSIHMKVNPCRYCDYKTVCHFDVFYNEYDLIEEESGDEDAI